MREGKSQPFVLWMEQLIIVWSRIGSAVDACLALSS
jgi:hypothetical protein